MAKKAVPETTPRRSSRLAGKDDALAPVPAKVSKPKKVVKKGTGKVDKKGTGRVDKKVNSKNNNKVIEDVSTSKSDKDKPLSLLKDLKSTNENKTEDLPNTRQDQKSRRSPRTTAPPKLQTGGKRVQFDDTVAPAYTYSPVESLSYLTVRQLVDALFDHVSQIIMLLNRWDKLFNRLVANVGLEADGYSGPDGVREGYNTIYAVLMIMKGTTAAIPAVKALGPWTPTKKATQVAMLNHLLDNQVGPMVVGGEGVEPYRMHAARSTNKLVKKIKTVFGQIQALHNSMDVLLVDLTNGALWEKKYRLFAKKNKDLDVSNVLLDKLVVVLEDLAESPTSPPCSPLVLYQKAWKDLSPKAKAKMLAKMKTVAAAKKAVAKARGGNV